MEQPADRTAYVRSRVREMADRRQLMDLHRATGISHSWLSKFGRGDFPNVRARRVDQLYTYFSGSGAADGEQQAA